MASQQHTAETQPVSRKEPVEPIHQSVAAQTGDLFRDLSTEVKDEVDVMRSGQQPIKPQADFLIRKHLIGIVILLFGLVALILLIGMGGISLVGHGVR